MKKIVKVINRTGLAKDTQVIVDGKKLPLSHLMSVDIQIRPDKLTTAIIELRVDDLEALANVDINK